MEKFQAHRDEAIKKLKLADHMLSITYQLVQDPKLLLAVIDNIYKALDNGISSVLEYDRLFKRIPPFPENSFEGKLSMFRNKCMPRYNIRKEYIDLIKEVQDVISNHKNSPVEFARKDKFVICSDNYKMKTVSIPEIKKYIAQAKLFIVDMSSIVGKNEGIFRSS